MSQEKQTDSHKGQTKNLKTKNFKDKYIAFAAIGMELVGLVFTSVYLGQFFDLKYGLKGFATAGFTLLSSAGWILHVILLVRRLDQ